MITITGVASKRKYNSVERTIVYVYSIIGVCLLQQRMAMVKHSMTTNFYWRLYVGQIWFVCNSMRKKELGSPQLQWWHPYLVDCIITQVHQCEARLAVYSFLMHNVTGTTQSMFVIHIFLRVYETP